LLRPSGGLPPKRIAFVKDNAIHHTIGRVTALETVALKV
jgi:hypothetical protein